jgi:hypothetical protein
MPKITEPLAYLTVLWRRYEATFAISMFETVRDRVCHKHISIDSKQADLPTPNLFLQWESVLLRMSECCRAPPVTRRRQLEDPC